MNSCNPSASDQNANRVTAATFEPFGGIGMSQFHEEVVGRLEALPYEKQLPMDVTDIVVSSPEQMAGTNSPQTDPALMVRP